MFERAPAFHEGDPVAFRSVVLFCYERLLVREFELTFFWMPTCAFRFCEITLFNEDYGALVRNPKCASSPFWGIAACFCISSTQNCLTVLFV